MSARSWAWVVGIAVALLLLSRRVSAAAGGTPPTENIGRFASAIASAEGYGVPGAIPTRANNPGDLKLGPPSINGITVFQSIQDGWRALYTQLVAIRDGRSDYYRPEMSIADMAELYAGASGAPDWATNVSRALGVSPSASIGGLL